MQAHYQIMIPKKFAKIENVQMRWMPPEQEPMLRFYKSSPLGFTLQIRVPKTKVVQMATVDVSMEEIYKLHSYAKKMMKGINIEAPKKLNQWERSSEGYAKTRDGRFHIAPVFMGRETAQSYECVDTTTGGRWSGDTQRDLKEDAEDIVRTEQSR